MEISVHLLGESCDSALAVSEPLYTLPHNPEVVYCRDYHSALLVHTLYIALRIARSALLIAFHILHIISEYDVAQSHGYLQP